MKNRKEFHWFTIADWEKEENYLTSMHKKGWRFTSVTGVGIYHFEECEPEDMVYQLDYNRSFREEKEEYLQIFHDCGWEFLQEYAGFTYFRKPLKEMKTVEGIFSDDESKLDMVKRIVLGRGLLLLPVFLLMAALCFLTFVNGTYPLAILYLAVALLYIVVFAIFFSIYMKKKKKLEK